MAEKKTKKKATRKAVKVVKKAVKKTTKTVKKTTKKAAAVKPTGPLQHVLLPVHKKLSQEDAKKIYEKYGVTPKQMPKILITDSAIQHLDVKEGDVIEITRKSLTADAAVYYRSVMNE